MSLAFDLFLDISQKLGNVTFLINIILKGSLILVLMTLTNKFLKNASSTIRYRILWSGFALLLLIPVLQWFSPHFVLNTLPRALNDPYYNRYYEERKNILDLVDDKPERILGFSEMSPVPSDVETSQSQALGTLYSYGQSLKGRLSGIRGVFLYWPLWPLTLWGLGSTCEFHAVEKEEVERQISVCGDFVQLAADVGAAGVKVRPNGLQEDKGIPAEQTLDQIGRSLRTCGEFAADHGVEIWLEVHGRETSHPPHVRTIMDHCNHPQVGVCWNSNMSDIKDGSVKPYFDLLKDDIKSCHITELANPAYPWAELFELLKQAGYDRFTLAEIQDSPDRERLLRYYRALWLELTA